MNTVKDLREALAEDVRRLQPPVGLESRVLRQALGDSPAHSVHEVASRRAIRRWESSAQTPVLAGIRALRGLAVVLIVLLILVGIVFGGWALRNRGTVPAQPPTHAVPRADSGMVSPTTGWQGGAGANIERTTDGGAHWKNVEPAGYLLSDRDSPYFLDATHAWITKTDSIGARLSIATYRTADGGRTWDLGTAISADGVDQLWPRLYFLDPTHGWLLLYIVTSFPPASETEMDEEAMYGTSDGGLHWVQLATVRHTPNACNGWVRVAFASIRDGWLAVGCSSPTDWSHPLLATHDGGKTWSPQALPLAEAGLTCPCFTDAPTVLDQRSAAIVVTTQSDSGANARTGERLFITDDGGYSWSARTLPGWLQQIGHTGGETSLVADFIDAKHGWTVAGPSPLYFQNPAGQPQRTGVPVSLYRTDDGGLTWVPIDTDLALADVVDLYFVDLDHGFAVLPGGSFFKTTDGGQHWKVVNGTFIADCQMSISSACTEDVQTS